MDINGTYQIDMEMSARKQVEGLLFTTQRLLERFVADIPVDPPDKEEHIQQVIGMYRENQQVFDEIIMTVSENTITVKMSEGEIVYDIREKVQKDESHFVLHLDAGEMGSITWEVTLTGDYFLFDSDDELSEYVFKRQ
ncbi:MAG: hypothetical protein ACYSWP_08510 [Planctomycetota bacterium]|jgi:hypothetical protein